MSERKKRKEYVEADRLSSLPEALVIHILSFLDTKYAVQASLSLKKWVHLWPLIPNLDFNSSVFRKISSFHTFVDKVLTLRDDSVKINKFSFSRKKRSKSKLFERVTKYVVSHDVQHFNICGFCNGEYIFIHPLGSSNSLKSLKINHCSYFCNFRCLEQLVTLHLEMLCLLGDGNFSNYPNLQNLTLKRCRTIHGHHLFSPANQIVAPKLSRLIILNCFQCDITPELRLSTPKLTFFKIQEFLLPVFETDELPLLDTVDMNVEFSNELRDQRAQFQHLLSLLMSMLKCFYNVNHIRLSWSLIELLSMFPDILAREPSPFGNLKSLNIVPSVSSKKTSVIIPGNVTTYLLRKCPDANTVIEVDLRRCKKCVKECF